MGLMDKAKQVAGEMGDAGKKGASQLRTKVEQMQMRRKADDAAKRLGYLVYRQRSGAVTTDGDIDALVAEIRHAEDQLTGAGAAVPSAEKTSTGISGPEVPPPAPTQAAEEVTGE